MTTNDLLREFIEWSNSLEPERNRISKARGNIFLKNHRPEFKNLNIPLVSNDEVALCPHCGSKHVKKLANVYICLGCHGVFLQTDC